MGATYEWTNGQPVPAGMLNWSVWVWSAVEDVVAIAEGVANEGIETVREGPLGITRVDHEEGLRAIPAKTLRTIAVSVVRGSLSRDLVHGVNQTGATESVLRRAEGRLEKLGYVIADE